MKNNTGILPVSGLVFAEAISLLGNQVAAVCIPILVLKLTDSPMLAAIAGVGNVLPYVSAALVGGHVIDRFGAWKTSILADLLSAVSVLMLPLVFLWFQHVPAGLLFLLVFLGAFFDPAGVSARQSLVPALSRRSGISLEQINSWRGMLENTADFAGPVLGVALIAVLGLTNAFFANALSFVLCALLFAGTVPKSGNAESTDSKDASWNGIQFIFMHRELRPLAIMGIVTSLIVVSFLALLLPVITTRDLKSATLLGLSLSAFGLAATIGAAMFSKLVKRASYSAIYYGGMILTGIAIILCGVATNKIEVIVFAGFAGLLLGAGNPLQQTILHEHVPEWFSGRAYASLGAVHAVAGSLGLLLAGFLVQRAGSRPVLIFAGAALLTFAAFGAYALPVTDRVVEISSDGGHLGRDGHEP